MTTTGITEHRLFVTNRLFAGGFPTVSVNSGKIGYLHNSGKIGTLPDWQGAYPEARSIPTSGAVYPGAVYPGTKQRSDPP